MEMVQNPGTPGFYSRIVIVPKKNGKLRPIRSFSSKPIYKERIFPDGDSQVSKKSDVVQRLGCLNRPDRCISAHSDSSSIQKVSSIRIRRSSSTVHGLTLRNVPKSVDFHQGVIAMHLYQRTISVFPYLDDWLVKDLIRNRLITQTKYCLQIIQNLGFIPNLKKSELMPAQNVTFIGMEFLTQQNLVRVPSDRVQFNSDCQINSVRQTSISARTFLSLLSKPNAAAEFVFLGRLHLRPLQMCLLSA